MQIQKTSGAFRKVPEVFCTVYSYRNEAQALRRLGVLACHLVARVLVHAAVVQASQQAAEDSAEEAQRQNQQNRQQTVREVARNQLLQGQVRDTVLE